MHLMHLIWVFGHIIGFFHTEAVIVICLMVVISFVLIFVFFKVFENDFFSDSDAE